MKFNIKKEWPLIVLLLIPLVAAIFLYPHMPEQVPIHWNVHGEVDDYGSRMFGTFFLPILNIALYLMFVIMPNFDPKRENYKKFESSYYVIRLTMHLLFAFLFGITAAASLGYPLNVGKWIAAAVAIMFIVMGNTMGRIRHNYFVGFKFPWTLANEEVWKKTHQMGAKAMVLGGVVALLGILLTEGTMSFVILMAGIFIPMIFMTAYSYLLYKSVAK